MNETLDDRLAVNKTAGELAALVGGKLLGDPAFPVRRVAGLSEAGPEDISFLGNSKYAQAAARSKAGCLLLPLSAAEAPALCRNRILVEDPQFAFSQVLVLVESQRRRAPARLDERSAIHPLAKLGPGVSVGPFAVVEKDAGIGEGTEIGAQVYIGENVRVGRFCKLHPGVVVRENCVIGDRVILQPGVVIGGDGYGFSTDKKTGRHRKIPQLGNVVLGDDVEVQANTTIDRATVGSTIIGPGTKVDNLVQIAHNVQTGRDCLFVSQSGIAGSSTLGDRVILAGQAGLAGHLKIGAGAIVMAQSGVMSDTPDGQAVFGSPARPHREAFKLQALYGRLPELFEAVKQLKLKLGGDGK
ncbi:MAG: UDP-3-O-(3-hydroxymyristoyl)glucosamine N-acyltransferase [Elusimicrobia bacterium]|nr:UDP-3-O-(3-hydroxymyristoyl)glucosamine N-acyltransferase [Elusimicrobiota bacterium]MDE2424364.1 UDP-3-O-(3-hydroxymyristoyl)glucosamine N-acyltransferase [Elusimicrobiota bacterium]